MKASILLLLLFSATHCSFSQDTALAQNGMLPAAYFDKVSSRVGVVEQKLDKHAKKALAALEKREQKIRAKLARLDSSKAKEVFNDVQERYTELKQKLEHPEGLTSYKFLYE